MSNVTVKKAIITAAGRGTRFLPITKVVPKELLPIGEVPTIHYLLEECKDSGIEEVCIVVREWGSLTEKYFERDRDLEEFLLKKEKHDLLEKLKDPSLGLKITFAKQDTSLPVGHGSPILSAKSFIDDDNFAMFFADDLIVGGEPGAKTLIDAWKKHPNLEGIAMSDDVPEDKIHMFSSMKFKERDEEVRLLEDYFEKPKSPENIFAYECFVGRAVCSAQVIRRLEENLGNVRASDGEFSLWDAMLDKDNEDYYYGVMKVKSRWLTTGNSQQMWAAQKAILGPRYDS